ncbi:Phosphoadenosine phosphosulfate reductase [Candidatus Magnetaquicoccaceae bacterium FCR-1]|uniref:Phosphoadenosine phosphosulfate reductase n=1 Tax=Candidatus Magnetaquiglobus chichijimensis TaxID=3141448 RepID=A0ABQ0C972_9PROT
MNVPFKNEAVHVLSVSGGKDSTAMYLLALESGVPFRAVFADTGNENQITLDYIRDLQSKTGGPEIEWVKADFSGDFKRKAEFIRQKWPEDGVSPERVEQAASMMHPHGSAFLDCCLMHGLFPGNKKMRFCSSDLKYYPIDALIDEILNAGNRVVSWVGVRAEESPSRAKLPEVEHEQDRGLTIFRPLLRWHLQDVIAIHARHGIELNPLYQLGMLRVGCMPCINSSKGELRVIAKRFPERIEMVKKWEDEVQKVSKSGKMMHFFRVDKTPLGEKTGDPSVATIDHVVAWANSGPGGDPRQGTFDLDDHSCMSALGVCE